MSQWADGGLLATKPYVSSAAYLKRMGDHCKGCRYDPKARSSDNACPFNALYWDFFHRNRSHFQSNPRLGVVYHQLKRMPEQTLEELRARSAQVLKSLDNL
jgi:deoxyribodipyrimidine photolyase-related protein